MSIRIILVFLLFLSIEHLPGQSKQSALNEYFSSLARNKLFNGNILVAENGKIIYQKSFGLADFSNKVGNNINTSFPLASVSKTITATAILQLVESGKLSVTDPVKKFLPEFPYPEINIQHLLSHTSGLPPYNAYFDSIRKQSPGREFTNVDFMDGIVGNIKPLMYPPGERGNYDNINFIVLSLVIEKLSGMPYKDYVSRYILRPAGMTNTLFLPLKFQYTQPVKVQFAYPSLYPHFYSDSIVKAREVPYIVSYWSAYNFSGFGDYIGTIHDLLKYDKAYYNNALLKKETIDAAFQPVKLNNGKSNPGYFGWGWEIEKDSSLGKIVYHNGNATGHSCILVRNITRHQTIIIFDNVNGNNSQELAFKAMQMLNGIKVPGPKKSIAKLYARSLLKDGPKPAREQLYLLKADTAHYQLSEDEMNSLGYDFMGGNNNPNPYHFPEEHKYPEALETLKLNTELFPNSWNVYDSYGEILLLMGQKEEAIKCYKKSIELNPNNTGGKKILERLAVEPEFDGHKWVAPYHFSKPNDWGIERFLIPISFAPQIAYKGVEDIRFTPGWAKVASEEYWTYAFLWYLDGSPQTDAEIIAANLKAYYTGLIEVNREGFKVPVEKVIPVQTSFKETVTTRGDLKTFDGTIVMLDYMQQKPMTLNCIVHLKACPDQNKTILFHEISPKPFTHGNWLMLNKLWQEFNCLENE